MTPKLRFKEFTGAWQENIIDDVISNRSKKYNPKTSKINYKCIELESLSQNTGRILHTFSSLEQKSTKNHFDEDNVLFGKLRPYLRKFARPKFKGVCTSEIWVLSSKQLVTDFLYQYIQTEHFFKLVLVQSGTKMPRANWEIVANGTINIPTFAEQTKIAEFFTLIDKKISQLQQQFDLLTEYKKGVMQQIFSQKLRFKKDDGSDFADWETVIINDFAKVYDGTHQTPKYVEKGIPFYSVEHLTANNFTKTKFISEEVFEKENKRVKLEKNDVLMTRIGDIGTSKLIDWDVKASFYVSLALFKTDDTINNHYFNQYIKSERFQKELYKRMIHSAFPKKINLGEIGFCKVQLPQLEEQNKIANFLTAIDDKIDNTKDQLEQTQQWKKGLLQQMFV